MTTRWIVGPCVLTEDGVSEQLAHQLTDLAARRTLDLTFKASFDKANRTRRDSYRGPGLERGLELLANIRTSTGLRVLTDVHEVWQVAPAAKVVDELQIPAFLCRQTDLIAAAGASGLPVNLKKGQFVAPEDMLWAVDKARAAGCTRISVTERGTAFGYRDLVVDPRSLVRLLRLGREEGFDVIYDGTHSVQRPSADAGVTGGEPEAVLPLARAAAAVGVQHFFFEVWPDGYDAPSDGANAVRWSALEGVIAEVEAIASVVSREA